MLSFIVRAYDSRENYAFFEGLFMKFFLTITILITSSRRYQSVRTPKTISQKILDFSLHVYSTLNVEPTIGGYHHKLGILKKKQHYEVIWGTPYPKIS